LAGYILSWYTGPKTVTDAHASINQAGRRETWLIGPTTIQLRHAASQCCSLKVRPVFDRHASSSAACCRLSPPTRPPQCRTRLQSRSKSRRTLSPHTQTRHARTHAVYREPLFSAGCERWTSKLSARPCSSASAVVYRQAECSPWYRPVITLDYYTSQ